MTLLGVLLCGAVICCLTLVVICEITQVLISSHDLSSLEKQRQLLYSQYAARSPDDIDPIFKLGEFYRYTYLCADPVTKEVSNQHCHSDALQLYLECRNIANRLGNIRINFDYVGMLNDLGLLLAAFGDSDSAVKVMNEGLSIDPAHFPIIVNLAGIENQRGNVEGAQQLYEKALVLQGSPALYHNVGVFAFANNQFEYALSLWEEAVRLDPQAMYMARSNIAVDQCSKGYSQQSQHTFMTAASDALRNNDITAYWSIRLQRATGLIHAIINSTASIATLRDSYIDAMLAIWISAPANIISDPLHSIGCGCIGYYIIYHGYEDVFLRQLQAQVTYHLSGRVLGYTSPHIFASASQDSIEWRTNLQEIILYDSKLRINKVSLQNSQLNINWIDNKSFLSTHPKDVEIRSNKIRIGFLSAFFYHHSVGLLMQGVIKHINRNLFDVFLIFVNSDKIFQLNQSLTVDLITSVDTQDMDGSHILRCSGSLQQHQQAIAALRLDVLLFTEIGMDHVSYMLSFARLARRSAVFWGHAITSGVSIDSSTASDGMLGPDYFLSSVLFEGSTKEPTYFPDREYPIHSIVEPTTATATADAQAQAEAEAADVHNRHRQQVRFSQFEYSERLLLMDSLMTFFEQPIKPFTCIELQQLLKERERNEQSVNSSFEECNNSDGIHSVPSKQQFFAYINHPNDSNNNSSGSSGTSIAIDWNNAHVYAIPQTLYKLHPTFDTILMNILLQDTLAMIVFPVGDNKDWQQIILQRLLTSIQLELSSTTANNILKNKLHFLRRMNAKEYLTFCAIADVILDPFPVGGGRSSLEIFSTGTPIVMLRPNTTILQLTYGMYYLLGVGRTELCCVSYSAEEYVRMSIFVVSNHSFSKQLRRQIYERANMKGILYNNRVVIAEWERALLYISSSPKPMPRPLSISSQLQPQQHDQQYRIVIDRICTQFCELCKQLNSSSSLSYQQQIADIQSEFLRYNPNRWRINELNRIHFNYIDTPILLRDIELVASDIVGNSSTSASAAATATAALLVAVHHAHDHPHKTGRIEANTRVNQHCSDVGIITKDNSRRNKLQQATEVDNLIALSLPLFIGGFSEVDRRGIPHSLTLSITGFVCPSGASYTTNHTIRSNALWDAVPIVVSSKESFIVLTNGKTVSKQSISSRIPNASDLQEVVIYSNWMQECRQQATNAGIDDKLKLLYICSIAGRAVHRLSFEPVHSFVIEVESNEIPKLQTHINVPIRANDDSGLLLLLLSSGHSQLGATATVSSDADIVSSFDVRDSTKEIGEFILNNYLSIEDMSSDRAILAREAVTTQWLHATQQSSLADSAVLKPLPGFDIFVDDQIDTIEHSNEDSDGNKNMNDSKGSVRIMLAMTTCKRLAHFVASVTALLKDVGPLPNGYITEVLVVDDNSDLSDRQEMQSRFPSFRFIWKMQEDRGHARSMNIIMRESLAFSAREKMLCSPEQCSVYLFYMEDDWKLLSQPVLFHSLGPYLQAFEKLEGSRSVMKHIIMLAVSIMERSLRNASQITVDQVLFNEQGSRTCAVASMEQCDTSIIGRGSWSRMHAIENISMHSKRFSAPEREIDSIADSNENGFQASFHYSLHEFGILNLPGAHLNRNHDFSNWPGLSLNPGLWAIDRICNRMRRILWRCTSVATADYCNLFDESDILFEQRWSVTAHAAELHMAYLPALIFEHIGDISAYELNSIKRPWDL